MAAKYVPDGTMQKIVDDAHSELQRYGVWNEQYFDSEEEMLDKIDDAFWKEIEDAAVKNGVRYYSDINI